MIERQRRSDPVGTTKSNWESAGTTELRNGDGSGVPKLNRPGRASDPVCANAIPTCQAGVDAIVPPVTSTRAAPVRMRLLFTATLRQLRLEVRRMMAAEISGNCV